MHFNQRVEAVHCFREVLRIEPKSSDALRCLADLALRNEDFDEAYDVYSNLVESGDQDAAVYYNTALLCQKRELAADAVSLYRQALSLEPEFGDAWLNLGHALMSLGEADEAQDCFLRAEQVKEELNPAAAIA
jgi:tetratricopeptide (TPR) repeat protein